VSLGVDFRRSVGEIKGSRLKSGVTAWGAGVTLPPGFASVSAGLECGAYHRG